MPDKTNAIFIFVVEENKAGATLQDNGGGSKSFLAQVVGLFLKAGPSIAFIAALLAGFVAYLQTLAIEHQKAQTTFVLSALEQDTADESIRRISFLLRTGAVSPDRVFGYSVLNKLEVQDGESCDYVSDSDTWHYGVYRAWLRVGRLFPVVMVDEKTDVSGYPRFGKVACDYNSIAKFFEDALPVASIPQIPNGYILVNLDSYCIPESKSLSDYEIGQNACGKENPDEKQVDKVRRILNENADHDFSLFPDVVPRLFIRNDNFQLSLVAPSEAVALRLLKSINESPPQSNSYVQAFDHWCKDPKVGSLGLVECAPVN